MRVHPVGLFCYDNSDEFLIDNVSKSCRLTHTHSDAINGAIMQTACVKWALKGSETSRILRIIGRYFHVTQSLHSKQHLI